MRVWRRLRLSLDHWVKNEFKNAANLSVLDDSAKLQSSGTTTTYSKDPVAGSNHQRWVILQAWTMKMLHDYIFRQYFPGLSQCEHELLFGIDQLIFGQSACVYPSAGFTNGYFRRFQYMEALRIRNEYSSRHYHEIVTSDFNRTTCGLCRKRAGRI